ncbi:MAG: glycosyltransferase [bacterium]|nr:glycosyltransferase [bacterium]
MKKRILFKILLNTRFRDIKSINPKWKFTSEDRSWIEYRINIFMQYTAQSLKNQCNQEFMAIILYRNSTEDIVKNLLQKYETLPDNIIFLNENKEDEFITEYLKDSEYLYEVRLDSDDCYIDTFVQDLYNVSANEETQCILTRWGYIWDHHSKRLGRVYYASPPFYTLIYDVKQYQKGFRYTLKGGHVGACRLECEVLEGEQYLFVLHDSNILATFEQRKQKNEILKQEQKKMIMNRFGILL